jgi:hypothetical protein
MKEFELLILLITWLVKGVYLLLRTLFRGIRGLVRWGVAKMGAWRADGPGGSAPLAAGPSRPATIKKSGGAPPPAIDRAAVDRVRAALEKLALPARALNARCDAERLCVPLRPTLKDFVVPALARAADDLRRASTTAALRPILYSAAYLDALIRLLSLMADQRCDPSLDELIDDADALAEACYRPVVDYCRTNAVPLSSNRTAAFFGDGCSPWLGRIDDPTGLAILHLPWKWLAELQRWPAIAHEVGHDFYDSVPGLDQELLRFVGLTEMPGDARIIDGRRGVDVRDVDRLVTRWRRELIADAFGVMMLGPAYAITTAAIFASPENPEQALAISVDGDEYEVHPPGHVRVAAVCRLLARIGYGAVADGIERRWRLQHGEPEVVLLPTTSRYLPVEDEPFIERAVSLTTSLQRKGFDALRGLPLSSMPGFDFGPREHEASLRTRDAFLAGGRPRLADARLLIAGAVMAWAERPNEGVRLLRAARLAVGRLDLPVPDDAVVKPRSSSSLHELVRDAVLLDTLLTPPRASLLRFRPRD